MGQQVGRGFTSQEALKRSDALKSSTIFLWNCYLLIYWTLKGVRCFVFFIIILTDLKALWFLPSVASVCEASRPARRQMCRAKEEPNSEPGLTLDRAMATHRPCSRLHIQRLLSRPLQRHCAGHRKTSGVCWRRQRRGKNVRRETKRLQVPSPTAGKEVQSFGDGKSYL